MRWNGPWNVEHNVAHALAARHHVLYVDPPLTPATPFRYGWDPASRRQLADLADRGIRRSGRVMVFTPLALPPLTHPHMRRISLPLVRAQIGHAAQKAGLTTPIVVGWRALNELRGAAGEALRVGVVMDHLPSAAALLQRDPADLEREVRETCEAADLLCVPSYAVKELLAADGWDAELLPFGFAGDLVDVYDRATRPPEYETLPRPLLGYTGSIDDRLDYGLITRLADRFPHGSIVFVGATSPRLSAAARSALSSRPNIHLLGVRPRAELPGYIRYLDCALLPYADIQFTRYQSPMKMWDYMYAGPPIVGTGSAELRRFDPPIMHFAETHEAAIETISSVIEEPGSGADERRAFALANTWDARAQQLDALVDDALAARAQPRAA
jgi:teichuronic acid biosynthesis glycosyltransferase TuaH